MIRLKVLFLFFLALQSAVGMAQTEVSFQVKGILLDSLTQEGEPYATIRIVRDDKPEKPVKMMVSDMKGRFRETVSGRENSRYPSLRWGVPRLSESLR